MKTHLVIGLALIIWSCTSTPPEHPPDSEITFQTIKNPELGYLVSIPSNYSIETEGPELICRMDDYPVFVINYVSKEEGDNRGLWPDHQPDRNQAVPNGWILYSYTHYDGPFGMETRSYVRKIGEKYISLDFRLHNKDRDIEMKILKSFDLG